MSLSGQDVPGGGWKHLKSGAVREEFTASDNLNIWCPYGSRNRYCCTAALLETHIDLCGCEIDIHPIHRIFLMLHS